MKLATVDGYIISTSIDAEEGMYIYFPLECVINSKFLKANNLYRKPELNNDSEAKAGFFEESGRVKCIKLRGLASEGIIIPLYELYYFINGYNEPVDAVEAEKLEGTEFDTVNDELFVWKYIPNPNKNLKSNSKNNSAKKVLNVVDNQYRQHVDTIQLQKAMYNVNPDDIISVSWKKHGTSVIFCNLLTYKQLSFKDRIAKWLGVQVQETEYKNFVSSRRVIKNADINPTVTNGYYNYDIWSIANEVIKSFVHPGMTIYGEIIGFMPDGSYIQKDYDYKCIYDPKIYDYSKMTPQQMYNAKLFDIMVYRITSTDI